MPNHAQSMVMIGAQSFLRKLDHIVLEVSGISVTQHQLLPRPFELCSPQMTYSRGYLQGICLLEQQYSYRSDTYGTVSTRPALVRIMHVAISATVLVLCPPAGDIAYKSENLFDGCLWTLPSTVL